MIYDQNFQATSQNLCAICAVSFVSAAIVLTLIRGQSLFTLKEQPFLTTKTHTKLHSGVEISASDRPPQDAVAEPTGMYSRRACG